MLNFVIITAILAAVLYVAYTYSVKRKMRECDKVEYRYRPEVRTFKQEQAYPVSPFGLFQGMFHRIDPWLAIHGNIAEKNVGAMQPMTWVGHPRDQFIRQGEDDGWENQYFS